MFYLELFRKLHENNIKYLVVGGLAVNLHGIPRFTQDVDLILALDKPNVRKFITSIRELGFSPLQPVNPEGISDKNQLDTWINEKNMIAFSFRHIKNNQVIDVLISHDLDFEEAFKNKEDRIVEGFPIHLASIEDLIKIKSNTGRQQDQNDVEMLRQVKRMKDNEEE